MGAENIVLNNFDEGLQKLIQADCLSWLNAADGEYDLIFLDPPTFSNSKNMQTTFDVQRDHVELLHKVSALLADDGMLVFSNNLRNFKMDRGALSGLKIEDISGKTIPYDFERNPRIHNCWIIRKA